MGKRKSEYPVLDIILNRRSLRAMSGKQVSHQDLMSLFEAARWAPSSYDAQPWRFVYAKKNTNYWDAFFGLLTLQNQKWVKSADVLIVVLSRKVFEYNNQPSRTHTFDAGSAWENLALQGTSMGLVVHAMEGFDYDCTRAELAIPEEYDIECMIAVGHPSYEPEEVTDRKSVHEIAFEGRLKV